MGEIQESGIRVGWGQWDRWMEVGGIFRLETFAGNFRLVTSVWNLSLGNFRLGSFAWELSIGNFRLGTFVLGELSMGGRGVSYLGNDAIL